MSTIKPSALVLSLGLIIAVGFAPLASAYDSFTDLGAGYADGINDAGQVVGVSQDASGFNKATLWNGITPTVLGGLSGTYDNSAYAINNSGQVAGSSYDGNNSSQAILWNGTTPTVLTSLGGVVSNMATGINNAGQEVGINNGNYTTQALLWNGTTPTVLSSLGGTNNIALGINDSGQVVGRSNYQAVLWNGTTPSVLKGLGGTGSGANAINNSGQVVGFSYTSLNATVQAVLWDGTTPAVLGGLGGTQGGAFGINNSGQVVGYSTTTSGAQHATMWTMQNGTMVLTDLNTLINPALGFTVQDALGINNSGRIVGSGVNSLGQQSAFVMSVASIPEPSEYMLMLMGFGVIGFMARRKNNSLI